MTPCGSYNGLFALAKLLEIKPIENNEKVKLQSE